MLLMATSGAASADVPVDAVVGAQALEAEGKKLYREGRFVEAVERYRRAYQLNPRPGTLFNMAQAHLRAGRALSGPERGRHYRRAIDLYREYLAKAPAEPRRLEIEALIPKLEREAA